MSVLSYLDGLASDLNIAERESGSINTSLDNLSSLLKGYFSHDIKEQFPFGSYKRYTLLPRKADSKSDVDLMIVFDNSNTYLPQTYLNRLRTFADKYYSTSIVTQSSPAIVLILGHIKFELVPAYRDWYSLYIPAPASAYSNWIITDPSTFNEKVDRANKDNKFKIKPTIRVVKYWNAIGTRVFTSYELEGMIADKLFWNCSNIKDYIFSFINGIGTYGLSSSKQSKIERAKKIIQTVVENEQQGMPYTAEEKIRKLFPPL